MSALAAIENGLASQSAGSVFDERILQSSPISDKSQSKIASIIQEVELLSDPEKLLLYLQLPNGSSHRDYDPLKTKGPGNSFGKKADAEVTQTYTWIQSHLVEDSTVSLPKHEVYEEYRRFCQASKFEPLCVADFGKAMKHVFPQVKPRRLGQRGNSKYCYSGLKMKYAMNKPTLPSLDPDEPQYEACDPDEMDHKTSSAEDAHHNVDEASSEVILSWAEKVVNSHFMTMKELSLYLIEEELVDSRSAAAQRVRAVRVGENGASDKNVKVKEEFPKRSAQINFNKTLGKKEQSRKLLEQTKGSKLGAAAPKGKKGRKTSGNGKPAAVLDHFKAADNGLEEDFERICKEEPKEDDEELDFSTHNSQPLSDELAGAGLANKVSISRAGTPSHIASSANLSGTLLVLPSIPQAHSHVGLSPLSASLEGMTSVSPSLTHKYKKIQPKPVTVNRSNSAVGGSHFSLSPFDEAAVKRRHSVSVPSLRRDHATAYKSNLVNVQHHAEYSQIKIKRHIEAESETSDISSKKRLVDSCDPLLAHHTNLLGNQAGSLNMTHNNSDSSNTGEDTGMSSASLSPQLCHSDKPSICNLPLDNSYGSQMVHDLETHALLEYFSEQDGLPVKNSIGDVSLDATSETDKWSQLRKLLEQNLPQKGKALEQALGQLQPFNELRQSIKASHFDTPMSLGEPSSIGEENGSSTSMYASTNSPMVDHQQSTTSDTSPTTPHPRPVDCLVSSPLYYSGDNSQHGVAMQGGDLHANLTPLSDVQTQVPSVPASPNSRRRAFNFQPISPRNTPLMDNQQSIVAQYKHTLQGNSYGQTHQHSPPQYQTNQCSVGVGPSQPTSATNSPFVSPRDTPVPTLSRSRNNSGQSCYISSRQNTPFQNQIDSGVSSISSSPFISPQSTPVPLMGRVRNGSGPSLQRALLRQRHSSGPGGPGFFNTQAIHQHAFVRSASLSPMVNCHLEPVLSTGVSMTVENGAIFTNGRNGNHTVVSLKNSNGATPMSPLSEPMSPNVTNYVPSMSDLVLHNNHPSLAEANENGNRTTFAALQKDWRVKLGPDRALNGNSRHRHMSTPYALCGSNENGVERLKNTYTGSDILNRSFNRCNSVPAQQMNLRTFVDESQLHAPMGGNELSGLLTSNPVTSVWHDETRNTVSKSYPATPVCSSQSFHFTASPPPSKLSTEEILAAADMISTVSGQDVMVSGSCAPAIPQSAWNSRRSNTELVNPGVRRNLQDQLCAPPPIEDDLQRTLDDLRDFDTDFLLPQALESGDLTVADDELL